MKHREFEFHFDGPHAEADAQALTEFLATTFPDAPTRMVRQQSPARTDGTRDIPIAIPILALLLALPAAVKHSIEINDRLKLQEKFARLVAWAKERRARRQRNPFVVLLPPENLTVPLDQVKPDQLLDALASQSPKPPRQS